MTDATTISLVSVGTVVISEGIKFLYGQAGELIKRLREQRKASPGAEASDGAAPAPIEVNVKLPSALRGDSFIASVDSSVLVRLEPALVNLRSDLVEYAEGIEPLDHCDHTVLRRIDELRTVLEELYKRELTFDGEERGSEGLALEACVEAGDVDGYVAGVSATTLHSGQFKAHVAVGTVRPGGVVVGASIDQAGVVRGPKE